MSSSLDALMPSPKPKQPGGTRFLVNWRCRLFMADKIIHSSVITAVFRGGYSLRFNHALPTDTEMNLEYAVNFGGELVTLRVKAKVSGCLVRSKGDGADIDLVITKMTRGDNHTMNNILQALQDAKEFNLRQ